MPVKIIMIMPIVYSNQASDTKTSSSSSSTATATTVLPELSCSSTPSQDHTVKPPSGGMLSGEGAGGAACDWNAATRPLTVDRLALRHEWPSSHVARKHAHFHVKLLCRKAKKTVEGSRLTSGENRNFTNTKKRKR